MNLMSRAILVAVFLSGCASTPIASGPIKSASSPATTAREGPAASRAGPCPEPLEWLESGSCLAIPEDAGPETQVLVYLHGMTASPEMARGSAGILGRAAAESGLAVLAPLGALGACNWSPEARQAWCWPSADDQLEEADRAMESIDEELEMIRERLGAQAPLQPVLVGYSNGGFMAMRFAARHQERWSRLVILHAGARPGSPLPAAPELPTLLRAASGDKWHHPSMEKLRDALQAQGWSPLWSVREGEHRFTEGDADAIVDFLR